MMCFSPDTLISTTTGSKPIGEVQPGEFVNAFDFGRGEWVPAEVLERHNNVYSGQMVSLVVGEARIEVTAKHPFGVIEGEKLTQRQHPGHLQTGEDQGRSIPGRWVDSHELQVGDVLVGRDGRPHQVQRVAIRDAQQAPVCNLTIRDHHSFAVSDESVLVHNFGLVYEP
ncbi:MAG: Hint domain-containing protein [Planctomycetaceae bacterium]